MLSGNYDFLYFIKLQFRARYFKISSSGYIHTLNVKRIIQHAHRRIYHRSLLLVDEMLTKVVKSKLRQRGPQTKLADAEVITIEIVGKSKELAMDKNIHSYFRDHWLSLFPKLGNRTTFVKRQIYGASSRKFAKILFKRFYRQEVN